MTACSGGFRYGQVLVHVHVLNYLGDVFENQQTFIKNVQSTIRQNKEISPRSQGNTPTYKGTYSIKFTITCKTRK